MTRRWAEMICLALLAFALGSTEPAWAEKDVDNLEELLPHQEAAWERLVWLGREELMPNRGLRADPPPLAPIRNCAEWEPCTGVMIRYPLGLPYALLRDLDDDVVLHVVVSSVYYDAAVTNMTVSGVDMDRVEFLVRDNNSIWTRDYGPWFVFDGEDSLAIIDHTYNRPNRPLDDVIPYYFGAQQGIPVHRHDMYHTGGNYMTDGAHVSASTRLVYDEALSVNGMTSVQVDQLMFDYYGVTTYHVLDDIESGGIHHIDTWAKFLDEETVLVKQVWPAHYTHSTLEQRATLLASLAASTGRNYRVHRVYCYDIGSSRPASYTNSLILNRRIYVPMFGNAVQDTQAVEAYQAAAPGYDVRGYYHSAWLTDDALHCRAMGVADRHMLRVATLPVTEDRIGAVPVWAQVHAHSGEPITSVVLFYRQDGGEWLEVPMAASRGDTFTAVIPEPSSDSVTDYYIHAADAGGRTAGLPRAEPASWYSFSHRPDLTDVPGVDATRAAALLPNFPNPFNPATTFRFELWQADHVELVVCDTRGRIVRRLVAGECPAGRNVIRWDGRDDHGRDLPSGVYVYRLRAAGLEYTRAATLIR